LKTREARLIRHRDDPAALLTTVCQEADVGRRDRDVDATVVIECRATNRVGRTTFMKTNQESPEL
jgi:hypothetical protein